MNLKSSVYLFLTVLLFACKGGSTDERTLPPGTGKAGEILLVIDSAKWNGPIGHELRVTFNSPVEDLPHSQSMFELRHVGPLAFKSILKEAKNLILLIPLYENDSQSKRMRSLFDQKSIDSLRASPNLFLVEKKNLYASNQEVLFIIGHSENDLVENLVKYRDGMRRFFNLAEDKRALKNVYSVKEEAMITNRLSKEHNFHLRVPYQYRLVTDNDGFIWLRLPGQEIDRNIIVAYKTYKDTSDFNAQNLVDWRNKIMKENVFGDPQNPDSYVITEPSIPPTVKQVSFQGKYAKKITGLWKTHDITMGGPFVAYSFVDQKLNRIYYVEGFLYSPGVEQRELMRELDMVLQTFRTSDM